MSAAKHDLTIEQGATFPLSIVWQDPDGAPINLTGYSVRCQVRDSEESSSVLLELDSESPAIGVTFGALDSTGHVDISVSAEITAALSFKLASYDLTVRSPGDIVTRLIEGRVRLDKGVTRDD